MSKFDPPRLSKSLDIPIIPQDRRKNRTGRRDHINLFRFQQLHNLFALSILIVLAATHRDQNRILLLRIRPRVHQPYVIALDNLNYPPGSSVPNLDELWGE